jgi:hypothetical protein
MNKKGEQQTDWVEDPQNALIVLGQQTTTDIQALATQLGYDGSLTVGALEDEIRFYQRRTVEACLELGKRLLLLKEITPHGEFKSRLELLGFADRSAQRFMQAALKTSKSANLAVLAKQSANPSKFLELIILDDEELVELTEGGSARGISLDDISTMSVTELRKALRDAKADNEALKNVNADTATQSAELKKELHKKQHYLKELSIDEQAIQLRNELDECVVAIDQQLRSQLKDGFEQLSQYARQTDTDHSTYMAAALVQLQRTIYRLREEFHLPDSVDDDLTPYWQRQLNGHE